MSAIETEIKTEIQRVGDDEATLTTSREHMRTLLRFAAIGARTMAARRTERGYGDPNEHTAYADAYVRIHDAAEELFR